MRRIPRTLLGVVGVFVVLAVGFVAIQLIVHGMGDFVTDHPMRLGTTTTTAVTGTTIGGG